MKLTTLLKNYKPTSFSREKKVVKEKKMYFRNSLIMRQPEPIFCPTQHMQQVLSQFSSDLLNSVTQSCPILCDHMDCSIPGFPVHHQLLEPAQTHVFWVSDAIQSSHPLFSPSPPTFSLSQHQGLFQWVSSSHQVAKILEVQLQNQTFQWIFRTDFL